MTISTRAQDVRGRRPQGKVGSPVYSNYLNKVMTLINSAPQTKQISTVTVGAATDDKAYVVTINGTDITYTSDASATVAEIADGLAEAINAEPMVRGQVEASSDGASVVTVTALRPGVAFTITDDDAQLTSATTTSAVTADEIPFGRLMISTGFQSGEANELGGLPKSTTLVAQVDTLAVTRAASEVYRIRITINGETYTAEVDENTDDNTTATDIRTAINAMMPANTVLAAGAAASVTLTAEKPGLPFVTAVSVKSETVARLTLTHTTASALTDLLRVARGVSQYTTDEAVTEIEGDEVVYPANAGVIVQQNNEIWVENSQSPSFGDPVFVETDGSGDNCGKLYTTTSATRIKLPLTSARWERAARASSGDNIAVVSLNF